MLETSHARVFVPASNSCILQKPLRCISLHPIIPNRVFIVLSSPIDKNNLTAACLWLRRLRTARCVRSRSSPIPCRRMMRSGLMTSAGGHSRNRRRECRESRLFACEDTAIHAFRVRAPDPHSIRLRASWHGSNAQPTPIFVNVRTQCHAPALPRTLYSLQPGPSPSCTLASSSPRPRCTSLLPWHRRHSGVVTCCGYSAGSNDTCIALPQHTHHPPKFRHPPGDYSLIFLLSFSSGYTYLHRYPHGAELCVLIIYYFTVSKYVETGICFWDKFKLIFSFIKVCFETFYDISINIGSVCVNDNRSCE